MKPAAFDYHVPQTVPEAVGLLADLGEDAKAIAGGQSLVPMLALRLAVPEHLVDLRRLDELRGITVGGDGVRIGAGTTQAAIERSGRVREEVPLLARATPLIGHVPIRNRGTLGGSLAHADAAAEYPAVVLALDARLEAVSPRGTRTIAATDFFQGMWSTALEPDELLTAVTFPRRGGRSGFGISEFARRGGDFALAGAAVALRLDGDDRITRCGIGLFGLGPCALRATAGETEVTGRAVGEVNADDLGRAAMKGLDSVPSDLHGSDRYRRRLGAAMVARAWSQAVHEATAGGQ